MGEIQLDRAENGLSSVVGATALIRPRRVPSWDALFAGLASGPIRSVVIRLFAAVWFLLLSAASVYAISSQFANIAAGGTSLRVAWPAMLSQGCIFVFYTTVFCIMILRPEPVSRVAGVGPAILTLAGSYGPWLISLLPRGPEQPALAGASAAILLVCDGLMVYPLIALGKSFSLMPQARKLVTSGPYSYVRHPLYLIEEAAVAGVLLQYTWFAALLFLVLHVAVQIRRMQLEEKVLRNAFPEYAAYAKRTPRLIPGVW